MGYSTVLLSVVVHATLGMDFGQRLNISHCQNAGILLDNRRGIDLRANDTFRNSDGKTGNELLCLVDRWGLGLSL